MSGHTPGPWRAMEYILPGPHPDEEPELRDYGFEVVADREGCAEPHTIVQTHALPGGGDFDDQLNEHRANARLAAAAPELLDALHEARRAIGDHYAPNDCYATGPKTGDLIRDLVQCPACSFIAMYETAIKKATTP